MHACMYLASLYFYNGTCNNYMCHCAIVEKFKMCFVSHRTPNQATKQPQYNTTKSPGKTEIKWKLDEGKIRFSFEW